MSAERTTSPQVRRYFDEIVGLRIYLALWVAIGHGLQLAGFERTNPLLKLLLNGHAAVQVFMIVSGFVIANLLLTKQESYPRYIARRFFRLYPGYAVCCVLGFFTVDSWLFIVEHVPWRSDAWWSGYAASIGELHFEATANFWQHAGLHALMLHGAVPDEIINRAPMVFLPAAWSISLEWQFYLIAPLVIAAFRAKWSVIAATIGAFILLLAYRGGFLGHYDIPATIAANSHFFLIGIASRLGFEKLTALPGSPMAVSAVGLFLLFALGEDVLSVMVWGVFLAYSLWHEREAVTGHLFRLLMRSRIAMLLGEASYSLYLIHRPIQVVFGVMAVSMISVNHWTMLGSQIAAILVALPLSIAMYFGIERPGTEAGRWVAGRLPAGRSTAGQPAVSVG